MVPGVAATVAQGYKLEAVDFMISRLDRYTSSMIWIEMEYDCEKLDGDGEALEQCSVKLLQEGICVAPGSLRGDRL